MTPDTCGTYNNSRVPLPLPYPPQSAEQQLPTLLIDNLDEVSANEKNIRVLPKRKLFHLPQLVFRGVNVPRDLAFTQQLHLRNALKTKNQRGGRTSTQRQHGLFQRGCRGQENQDRGLRETADIAKYKAIALLRTLTPRGPECHHVCSSHQRITLPPCA